MLNFIMCRDRRYKKEAVQRHREMWNWIADQVEKDGLKHLSDIKNWRFANCIQRIRDSWKTTATCALMLPIANAKSTFVFFLSAITVR